MITCPRCGLQLANGIPSCPRCGTVFAPAQAAPAGSTDASIPAWVRQFQAQQQAANPGAAPGPAAPPPGPNGGGYPGQPGYAPGMPGRGGGNLFDEGALPEWLRQGANGMANGVPNGMGPAAPGGPRPNAPQPPYGPAYPAPAPAYGPTPGYPAPGDMNARALIDDRALPGWMNQPPQGAQANGANGLREGLDARSLIDEGALPQWLRGGQQGGASDQWNAASAAQEPLPTWLTQQPPPSSPLAPRGGLAAGPAPMPQGGAMQGRPMGVAAPQLADESALPEWLRSQGMAGASSSAGNAGARPAMAANNLVDPGAMPAWVRSGSASAEARFNASAAGASPPPAARRPPDSSWLTDARVPASPVPGPVPGPIPGPVPGLLPGDPRGLRTAELPAWLQQTPRNAAPPAEATAVVPAPNAGPNPADPFIQPGNLKDNELPPWLNRGQGAGQPQAPRPAQPARQQPPAPPQAAPPQQGYARDEWDGQYSDGGEADGYGDGYGDGYDDGEAGYPDEDAQRDWDDGRDQRRGGFFGRFRRK